MEHQRARFPLSNRTGFAYIPTVNPNNPNTIDMESLVDSDRIVRQAIGATPAHGVAVLGSGWGALVESLDVVASLPFRDIPCLGTPGVKGHDGTLHRCRLAGRELLVFQGRRHWYEGQGWTPIAFPVYLARTHGASTLLLTNAAGAIDAAMSPGDLMLVRDHINAIGANPLAGPHIPFWGARFPDQSAVYDTDLRSRMRTAAAPYPVTLHEGVYLAVSGPFYETPAEVKAFRTMGADAIGMSTVPEAMLGAALGLRVAAVSCITNHAAGVHTGGLTHDDVLAVTRDRMPVMAAVVHDFLTALCAETAV